MSLDKIIKYEDGRRKDGYKVIFGEMTSHLFMAKYCLTRDMTATYLRQYRKEIRMEYGEYNHLTRAYK